MNYTQANNWETEVNNSLGTADVIDANMTKYGSLMSGADVDGINTPLVRREQLL